MAAVEMVGPQVGPVVPTPPVWHRPIGDAPRSFLSKGAGTMANSPRLFHKVSRRSNTSGHAEINAANYSSREFLPKPARARRTLRASASCRYRYS